MKTICCICKKEMAESSGGNDEHIISHGYCGPCATKIMYEELGVPVQDFLDSIGVPVLLIEPGLKVRTVNTQASSLLGKNMDQVQGTFPGDVIECEHAKQPGGCGRQHHCKACTIRNTVTETFETGKSFENVMAYPDVCFGEETKSLCIAISTEKIGEMVLLRIDDLREKNA